MKELSETVPGCPFSGRITSEHWYDSFLYSKSIWLFLVDHCLCWQFVNPAQWWTCWSKFSQELCLCCVMSKLWKSSTELLLVTDVSTTRVILRHFQFHCSNVIRQQQYFPHISLANYTSWTYDSDNYWSTLFSKNSFLSLFCQERNNQDTNKVKGKKV